MRTGVILVNSNVVLEKAIIDSCISKPNINILEIVSDSITLMDAIVRLKPKVIIVTDEIDESPFEIIIKIMEANPIPCLLIHSKEHEIDTTLTYALEYGIVDVIDIEIIEGQLRFPQVIPIRLSILGKLNVKRFIGQIEQVNKAKSEFVKPKLKSRKHFSKRKLEEEVPILSIQSFKNKKFSSNSIIVIAASTGGPKMIVNLISQLPRKFPPVIVIQHMPEGFLGPFADRINTYANMETKLAQEGDIILPNHVYVAPGGRHLEVEHIRGGKNVVHLIDSEKVNFVKPAADVTLKSVARIYNKNTFAVILTGMGADGRDGCKAVKEYGGRVIALNEEDSVIFGMNQSVINAGYSDLILGLNQIAYHLAKWIYDQ
ncbi:MAG: chemotaxis protein CheB [Candidatus Heimdallarchaeota archaeon]|nr:chemotaxis protein CheB [Candidatus Heimdallarchaeota archaeon]